MLLPTGSNDDESGAVRGARSCLRPGIVGSCAEPGTVADKFRAGNPVQNYSYPSGSSLTYEPAMMSTWTHVERGLTRPTSGAAQIPYRAVEVNPLTKAELKWGPHRHVPVALLDQEVLADSSAIVSRLAAEAEAAKAAQQPSRKGWLRRGGAPSSAPQPSPASLGEAGVAPGRLLQ